MERNRLHVFPEVYAEVHSEVRSEVHSEVFLPAERTKLEKTNRSQRSLH